MFYADYDLCSVIYQPLNNCATVTITHLGILVIQGHRVLRSTVKRFQIQKEAILSPFSFALPRSVLNYFMLATTDWCLVVTQVYRSSLRLYILWPPFCATSFVH